MEELLIEQITKQNEVENRKWVEAELVATTQWLKLQQYRAKLKQAKLEQEAKLKLVCYRTFYYKVLDNNNIC